MSRRVVTSMGMQHLRSLLRLSPLVSVLALGACASVLGIEDLSSDPAPGGAGDNGTGNNTGNSSSGGNSGGGGKTSTPNGGNDSQAGEGPNVNGGNGNEAGVNNVPMAGEGNVPTDPTVRGKLIDFWGHVLPNVAIQIGETLTSSDENGEFVIEDVPATYDVSFHVTFMQYSQTRSFGWVFQGLTRRDPTLQVSWGLPVRSGNIAVFPQNATPTANQSISVAIGGEDGNTLLNVGANGVHTSASWEGGDTSSPTAHGLFFQFDADTDFPTSYLAHDSTLVALQDSSEESQITLDLEPGAEALDAGNLQGTVDPASGTERENSVFLRFDSGAAIQLLLDYDGPNAFSYLVPSVPKSTITVAASEGDAYYGASYAVAHANGLAVSDEPALVIPTPASITSPADQITDVDATTMFAFQSPASNPGPFVVQFENVDTTGAYQTLYVVTTKKQLTMPEVVGGGFAPQKNKVFEWRVATHGTFASVDEMAGPSGYLDPFAVEEEPVGPNLEDGQYTISSSRVFTTAP